MKETMKEVPVCLVPKRGHRYKMAKTYTRMDGNFIEKNRTFYTNHLLYDVGQFVQFQQDDNGTLWALFDKDGTPVRFVYTMGTTCFSLIQ